VKKVAAEGVNGVDGRELEFLKSAIEPAALFQPGIGAGRLDFSAKAELRFPSSTSSWLIFRGACHRQSNFDPGRRSKSDPASQSGGRGREGVRSAPKSSSGWPITGTIARIFPKSVSKLI